MAADSAYQKILLVTDGQTDPLSTQSTAEWLASRYSAELTIMDTMPQSDSVHRWISGMSRQEYDQVRAGKEHRVAALASKLAESGLTTNSFVGIGKSSAVISQYVLEHEVDLVIRYRKGCFSQSEGLFGNTAKNLVRDCACPILFTAGSAVIEPQVLACVDTSHGLAENRSIVRQSSKLAGRIENLWGLYCWDLYLEDLVKNRMQPGEFDTALKANEAWHQDRIDRMCETLDVSRIGHGISLRHGRPVDVIPKFCDEHAIDVVTMCTATLNHPLKRLFGSTADALSQSLDRAILFVKPEGFTAPETLHQAAAGN